MFLTIWPPVSQHATLQNIPLHSLLCRFISYHVSCLDTTGCLLAVFSVFCCEYFLIFFCLFYREFIVLFIVPSLPCRPSDASSTCCVLSSTRSRREPSCKSSTGNTPSLRMTSSTLCITTSYVRTFTSPLRFLPTSCHQRSNMCRIAPLKIRFLKFKIQDSKDFIVYHKVTENLL